MKPGEEAAMSGPFDYYLVYVPEPSRESLAPYTAECEDLIVALTLTWHEANIFKALWRRGQQRKGRGKQGVDPIYDAKKILYFARRLAQSEGMDRDQIEKALGFGPRQHKIKPAERGG